MARIWGVVLWYSGASDASKACPLQGIRTCCICNADATFGLSQSFVVCVPVSDCVCVWVSVCFQGQVFVCWLCFCLSSASAAICLPCCCRLSHCSENWNYCRSSSILRDIVINISFYTHLICSLAAWFSNVFQKGIYMLISDSASHFKKQRKSDLWT